MMSEWKEYKLEDFAEINPTESIPKGKVAKKIPMEFIQPFTKRIPDYLLEEYKGGVKFRNGDTLMARITPSLENGKTSYVDILEEDEIGFGSTEFIVLREKENVSDKHFLYYLSISPTIRFTAIKSMTGSSGRQRVQTDVVKEHVFDAPELNEQNAIASVLSSLDDKIDLLHRQNQTLEQMAEALFRQWFVERRPELAEGEADEAILVTDIIDFNPSLKLGKGALAPYLEMKNLEERSSVPNGWRYREFTSGMRFQNGDTLFARISPCLENGKSCYVQFMQEDEVGWGSTEFIVMRSKNGFSRFLSYVLANSSDFKDFAANTLAGSSGRQRAQLDIVKEYELVMLNPERLGVLNGAFDAMSKRIGANEKTIRTLTHLRDTLLPKLMSGEVKVKND